MTTLSGTPKAFQPIISALDGVSSYAHWTLRIALASIFLYHGLTKFPVLSEMAGMMGLPVFVFLLVALAETGAGAFVLLGGALNNDLLTRLGGLLVLPPMLGAIFMVHWGQWSFVANDAFPMGGMEFQVAMVLIAIYLVLKGNNA